MKYLFSLLISVLFFSSCSEPAGIDENLNFQEGEGFYLGATLDSNKKIHSRSDPLYIELNGVYSISECVVQDFFLRPIENQANSHFEIVLPFGGEFEAECPLQNGLNGIAWWMSPDQFPLDDSLVIYGQSDYLRDLNNDIIGERQGLIPLDTIELRWGRDTLIQFNMLTDSFAQVKGDYLNKKIERILVNDTSASYYLELYDAKCPNVSINESCQSIKDTAWSIRLSARDTIDDSTFVKIDIDTVQWVVSQVCSNSEKYCDDIAPSSLKKVVEDTTLRFQSYETWLIERLSPCALLSDFTEIRAEEQVVSKASLPSLASYQFQTNLFFLDESREECQSGNHFYGYSFERDSAIIDQVLLDSLWKSK